MNINLEYQLRDISGGLSGRRMRRVEDMVPAIIYGGGKSPQMIKISHRHLAKVTESESFFSQVVRLSLTGDEKKSERVVLKLLQRHPYKRKFIHADFLRVREDVKLTLRVPLHFINEDNCKGVKQQGGVIAHDASELEIQCLPKDLPPFIEVDMADVELNHVVHLSDVKLPEGVEMPALSQDTEGDHSHDLPVVRVIEERIVEEVEDEDEETPDDGESEEDEENDNKDKSD